MGSVLYRWMRCFPLPTQIKIECAFKTEVQQFPFPSRTFPTIVYVFCLHTFTRRGKLQSNRRLWVKAKGVPSFTAFTTFRDFPFIANSLTACNLGDSVKAVKAVKAKNKTFNVVTRAYA